MQTVKYDVVIIGGGPAGMGAGIKAKQNGSSVVVIEREENLGGILKQCIHSGFGLHYFKQEMTGPEYAHNFIMLTKKSGLDVLTNSFVVSVSSNKVIVKNKSGIIQILCKSVVLAMGARERTAGAIKLNGTRPAGVYTAGQVQKWVNMYGKLPCKNPIILGSGDIGLIMARRLTLEGAKPQMVLEIEQQTSGLARNISQCLNDFNIPLYLSTTVVEVVGYPNITGVVIAKVDENKNVIPNTKKLVKCDGLVLSVGLIPDNDLLTGAKINPKTNSFIVDEYMQTSIKNVFACGNVLHIHDLVDFVTQEAELAGLMASNNAKLKLSTKNAHNITAGDGVRYTVPNIFYEGDGNINILFRVTKKFIKSKIAVMADNKEVASKFVLSANAGEMQTIQLNKKDIKSDLQVVIKGEN